jgi:hypothetical protein
MGPRSLSTPSTQPHRSGHIRRHPDGCGDLAITSRTGSSSSRGGNEALAPPQTAQSDPRQRQLWDNSIGLRWRKARRHPSQTSSTGTRDRIVMSELRPIPTRPEGRSQSFLSTTPTTSPATTHFGNTMTTTFANSNGSTLTCRSSSTAQEMADGDRNHVSPRS